MKGNVGLEIHSEMSRGRGGREERIETRKIIYIRNRTCELWITLYDFQGSKLLINRTSTPVERLIQ